MQMKQQQELERYLHQIQENIETVSVSELLQALMSQQSASSGTAWSSFVQLTPPPTATNVIYSTAGLHQSPLPTTFVPLTHSDASQQQMLSPSMTVPHVGVTDILHSESVMLPLDGLTVASDSWPVSAVPVSDVNVNTTVIPDVFESATELVQTGLRSCSPSASLRRTSSLKEQVRPTASSDCETTNSEQSLHHISLHCKQSAEAAALLSGPATDPVDTVLPQLLEVSSLGFVPIQNQPISSRSDSMDSMASSVAGCSHQQSVDSSDLMQVSHAVCVTVADAVTSSQPNVMQSLTHSSAQLLDTLQSLLEQLTAGHSDAIAAVKPSPSSPSRTVEPAQQLQQSQAIIQQQQQQQLTAIASAIENLQHLRSLQEAIGSLAVALKTSQLQMLTATLQAAQVNSSTDLSAASNMTSFTVAGAAMTAAATPTLPVSSFSEPVHVSPAMPPAVPVSATVPGLASDSAQLTAAQLAALGLLQYPTAACGNVLPMLSSTVQQQQQQLLLAMMQSVPYQQQQQQLLMQQLLSQNTAMMHQQKHAGPRVQHPWPSMMMMAPPAHCVASSVQPCSVPHSGLPVMSALPAVSTQPVPQQLGMPTVVSPGSLPVTSTLQPPDGSTSVQLRSGTQTPVAVPISMTTASVAPLQMNLPDQR